MLNEQLHDTLHNGLHRPLQACTVVCTACRRCALDAHYTTGALVAVGTDTGDRVMLRQPAPASERCGAGASGAGTPGSTN